MNRKTGENNMVKKSKSRIKNSIVNTSFGFFTKFILMLLAFINRTYFLRFLSIDYLGINGLYTNILTVLSLAELGIGNVMIYNLYKPTAAEDHDEINQLLSFYRKLYIIIAAAVATIGIILVPFLPLIIKSDLNYKNLLIYYILFLFNSVLSYFVAHKTALIQANQQLYIIKRTELITSFVTNILQILVLILYKNYIVYLIVKLLGTVFHNFLISRSANKEYSYLEKTKTTILVDKKNVVENIKSTFVYKVGITIVNSTDDILISSIFGTVTLGYYSNYELITAAVLQFTGIINVSLIPSLGNLNAEDDMKKSSDMFFNFILFYHWLGALCGICLFLIFNDFISIWIGKEYLMTIEVVILIALNFYLTMLLNPMWMFRETMGLFVQMKYVMLVTAILNIILSLILGNIFGVAGILMATFIAKILTQVWYEPIVLLQKIGLPLRKYWSKQIYYVFLSILSLFICYYCTLTLGNNLFLLIIRGLICFIVTLVIFFFGTFKSKENNSIREYIRKILYSIKKKVTY